MFNFFKNIWAGAKELWARFEAWVASWLPGLKTYLVNAAGMLAVGAAALEAYLKNVDLSQVINAKTLAITMVAVSTLTFWLANIPSRVASREETE